MLNAPAEKVKETMKTAIQFGAGNIGRGFIGAVLSKSGYQVVFADVNKEIVDRINADGQYTVHIKDVESEDILISGVSAVDSSTDAVVEKIKEIAGDMAVVFMSGDLNTISEDKNLKPLNAYMKESAKIVKKADKTPSFNDFGRKGSRPAMIDHIFYYGFSGIRFRTVTESYEGIQYLSDHYPVSAILEFPEK